MFVTQDIRNYTKYALLKWKFWRYNRFIDMGLQLLLTILENENSTNIPKLVTLFRKRLQQAVKIFVIRKEKKNWCTFYSGWSNSSILNRNVFIHHIILELFFSSYELYDLVMTVLFYAWLKKYSEHEFPSRNLFFLAIIAQIRNKNLNQT